LASLTTTLLAALLLASLLFLTSFLPVPLFLRLLATLAGLVVAALLALTSALTPLLAALATLLVLLVLILLVWHVEHSFTLGTDNWAQASKFLYPKHISGRFSVSFPSRESWIGCWRAG
jgi:hypothetical protein